jgi:hypothetical protein
MSLTAVRVARGYFPLFRQAMQQSRVRGVLSNHTTTRVLEASVTPILPGQRAPFIFEAPENTQFVGGSRLSAKPSNQAVILHFGQLRESWAY